GRPVVSADVVTDPELVMPEAHRRRFELSGRRALIAAPLSVKGRVIGAVVATDSAGRAFTPADTRLAQALADQAALALDNARPSVEADRRRQEAEALAELSRALTEMLDPALIAQRVVESVTALVQGRAGSLRLLQPDGSLVAVAATGPEGFGATAGHVMPPGHGLSAVVLATGRPVLSPDVPVDAGRALPGERAARARLAGFGAWLAVPVRVKGAVIGVLSTAAPTGRTFSDQDARLLEAFADRAALALENARLFADEDRRRREAEVA